MTVDDALARLTALGDAKVKAQALRRGAPEPLLGVQMGDIRKVAAQIKTDHALGLSLWETGILEARLLAILVMTPKRLSQDEADRLARQAGYGQVADWLSSYVLKVHPEKEALRQRWMQDADPWAARAGWSLTWERVAKEPEGLDLPALLDRIEAELQDAPAPSQWTMNATLATIGIHAPSLRARALEIGERLGVYRDYPVSKGCTSPFAPIWIGEMVRRQG